MRPLWLALLLFSPAAASAAGQKEAVPTITFVTPQLNGPQASPTLITPTYAAAIPQLNASIIGGAWKAAPMEAKALVQTPMIAAQAGLPQAGQAAAAKAAAAASSKDKAPTIMAGLTEYGANAAATAGQKDALSAKTGSEAGFMKAARLGAVTAGSGEDSVEAEQNRAQRPSGLAKSAGVAAVAKQDADKPYDFRKTPVHQDDAITLLISGFRFDEATGRVMKSPTEALTYGEMARISRDGKLHRRRSALERIWHLILHEESNGPVSRQRIESIVAEQKDVLPPRVVKPWLEKRFSDFKEAVESRYLGLTRLDGFFEKKEELVQQAKGDPEAASKRTSYFDEGEAKLGAVIQKGLTARLSRNPEGRKVLEEIKALGGTMPALLVLKLDERWNAFYTSYNRSVVLNFSYLITRVPGAQNIKTPAALADFLIDSPALLDGFLDDMDVTLLHELVHYKQDLAGTFQPVTRYVTHDIEYEAFFRQNLYFHHKLLADPSAINNHSLAQYIGLVNSFNGWKEGLDDLYSRLFPSSYADLETGSQLQKERSRLAALLNEEGTTDDEKHALKRLTLINGHRAIRQAREREEKLLAQYAEQQWPLRQEGYPALARAFAAHGHAGAAADFMTFAAKENPALEAEAEELSRKALAWLTDAGRKAPITDRFNAVNAVTRGFSGKAWPLELFQAGVEVYGAAVAAGHMTDYSQEMLRDFKSTARGYVGQYVEFALKSATPRQAAANLQLALKHAVLVGDMELINAVTWGVNLGLDAKAVERIRELTR